MRGRCAICLNEFANGKAQPFSERGDLARLDECFHRYHLVCIYHDWFVERQKDVGKFGEEIAYELPEQKKCPICRRDVSTEEKEKIRGGREKKKELVDVYL